MVQNKRMGRVLIVDREGITGGRVDLGKVRNQSLLLRGTGRFADLEASG